MTNKKIIPNNDPDVHQVDAGLTPETYLNDGFDLDYVLTPVLAWVITEFSDSEGMYYEAWPVTSELDRSPLDQLIFFNVRTERWNSPGAVCGIGRNSLVRRLKERAEEMKVRMEIKKVE